MLVVLLIAVVCAATVVVVGRSLRRGAVPAETPQRAVDLTAVLDDTGAQVDATVFPRKAGFGPVARRP